MRTIWLTKEIAKQGLRKKKQEIPGQTYSSDRLLDIMRALLCRKKEFANNALRFKNCDIVEIVPWRNGCGKIWLTKEIARQDLRQKKSKESQDRHIATIVC